jgi:hypothetical protein
METLNNYKIIKINNLERHNQPELKVISNISKIYILSECFVDSNLYFFKETSNEKERIRNNNNFLNTFLLAYNNHGDIVISPDEIWIMIMLFLSNYIDENAEKLRSQFVKHEGQQKLQVKEYPSSLEGSIEMEKHWDYFFEQIIKQINENTIEGTVEALECNFSTTTKIHKLISTATIMNSFKKYFEYSRAMFLCGINNVLFTGTRNDWTLLLNKTLALTKYDVGGVLIKYVEHMKIILNEFINTYDGNVNSTFWNKIMDIEKESPHGSGEGKTYISGWILNFFGLYEKTNFRDVPSYKISIPIELINEFTSTTKKLNLDANFISTSRVGDYAYKPDLAICLTVNSDL